MRPPQEGTGSSADLPLGEKYTYDEVKLGAGLGDDDFSTANPEYNFQRKLK